MARTGSIQTCVTTINPDVGSTSIGMKTTESHHESVKTRLDGPGTSKSRQKRPSRGGGPSGFRETGISRFPAAFIPPLVPVN